MSCVVDVLAAVDQYPRVLIVEDDPVSALLLRKLFQAQGIAADRAANGDEALALHKEKGYRLVVSDWIMPEMTGIDLCQAFRTLDGPYVYFILCSAKGERQDRIQAFEAGVDDFLTKPLDRDELQARLKVARRILSSEDRLQRQNSELEKASDRLMALNANLTLASARFAELFNGLPMACFTFDEEGLIHEWNRSAEELFQVPGYRAFQMPVWHSLGGPTGTWSPDRIQRFLSGSEPNQFDWIYTGPDGVDRFFACSLLALRSAAGQVVGAISANLDVTERRLAERRISIIAKELEIQQEALLEANQRLEHLATTDGLTGLLNHRFFQETLEESFTSHQLVNIPLSLVLLDIDHFKNLNDDFGHQAGDEVLKAFARVIQAAAGPTDVAARYGGEEFAVLMPGVDAEGAQNAAERMRKLIEAATWMHRPITATLGVATTTTHIDGPKALVAAADRALYAGKASGRNRVTHCAALDSGSMPKAA